MSAEDITAWGTVAAAVFLALGALVAWIEIRRGAKARETALLLDLAFRWLDKPMVESMGATRQATRESVRSLVEKDVLSEDERTTWNTLQRVPNFLEAVGYLEQHRAAIKVRDVEGFWGSQIIYVWCLWEPSVRDLLRPERKTAFLNLERLATKVDRYRKRRMRRERIRELLRALLPGLPR
jgi:hypothetical protein